MRNIGYLTLVLAGAALSLTPEIKASAQSTGDTAIPQPSAAAAAQAGPPPAAMPAAQAPAGIVLPVDTIVAIVPVGEITSMHMHVGDIHQLQVANDIVQNGVVMIPRGAPVKATVTWRTGKGIVGKSAKFVLTFNSVNVHGRDWALKGTHRQEGRGNTLAALLGSTIVTGHSAVILSGQVLNAFTAEPITAS